MKSNRIDEERRGADDPVMTETVIHDRAWGDSAEGPVRGEGELEPPSPTGAAERMLERDARRDPWGGPSVQNVGELPSGYYRDRQPAEGYTENPDDRAAGGDAGIVGLDDRLIDRGA